MSFVPNYVAVLIAAVSGAVLVCGFAPLSWWWLTLVCPAVLYMTLIGRTPGNAFLIGFVFGLVFFGLGVSWTFNSIHEFGHAPVWLSVFLVALLVIVLALFPAFSAFLFSRVCRNSLFDISSILAFSVLWTLFEWVRGWIFTGFPWLLMGHAHHSSPLQGVLPVLGTYGATWVAVLLGCLAMVLIFGMARQRLAAGISLVLVVSALLVGNQVTWTSPDNNPLSVVLIQGNISQEMKWDRAQHPHIFRRYLQLSEAHLDADIIIWPESAIPTYYFEVKDSFILELEEIALAENVDFLVGLFTYDQDSKEIYNSVMTIGEEKTVYTKRHLVPFGEYIPFRNIVPFLTRQIELPMSDISSGSGRPLVKLKGYFAGASICYEVAYGNEMIEAMPEAKFLFNVSNDAWFGDSFAPHQHLEIARSRAVESGRYLLRATSTGISAIVDPHGTVVERSAQFQEDIIRANIQPHTGLTPYSRWGNWTIITTLSGIFLIICLYRWRRMRSKAPLLNQSDPGFR